MRSGFRSSISGLNSGVLGLSVLASSRVSDPAEGAASCVKKRSASVEWDLSKEPPLGCPPRKRIRNATTRITANKNRADKAPVMMATRGLMAIPLEDGSGRGASTVHNSSITLFTCVIAAQSHLSINYGYLTDNPIIGN